MAKQLAFSVNIGSCTGCKACQVACKDKNNLPVGIRWRRVFQYESGEWVSQDGMMVPSNMSAYFVSAACMHCEAAPCVDVCPAKAMIKRADGIVYIEQSKCIGCGYCSWACPYGSPQMDEDAGVMTKCNFCKDLIDQGERPACVDACPYRALDFGELDELRMRHGNLADPAPLPDPTITRPSVVYIPTKFVQVTGKSGGRILNLEEK
jgi:anaerobic dimethyl sulfoxide reductase subunit B